MAEGVLIGGAVGAAFNDLYNVAKDAVSKVVCCKKYCQALEHDLSTHLPIFNHFCLHMQMPPREWEQRLLNFEEQLKQGRLLVESCLQLRRLHFIQRFRHSRAILKLRKEILQLLQTLPALNMLQLQQLSEGLQDVREQQEKCHEELMGELKGLGKTTFQDWVLKQASSDGTDEDVLEVDQFLVGLDEEINEVKSLLLSSKEKMVTIVGGMGGIGKTTLALAVCNDPQVRGFFEDRIHFFTVSQSPDMKGLLSTIWQRVIRVESVPLFQNVEDAYKQVTDKLKEIEEEHKKQKKPLKPRLLVLDDVWSKANLENLSFKLKGLKTLITTRQASILGTYNSLTYTLGLLSEESAQSLFCYWAFRQDSIPAWAEKPLVKEIISECKCLPLSLKVIGASLFSDVWVPIEWRNARDKLREAKPLGDYHKDALQRRLQTSIDALDPILRECFLDLGAYPEDARCSADTLLDIWVYVRGMEWADAFLALAELGRRCLLNFENAVMSNDVWRAIECGNASALVFSQHDVMRDLALYLGRENQPPSQRTRLLMPQKGKNIPKDWQPEHLAPLAAQIISISTGAMMEQDWPPTLAFPSAEALLLYFDGDAYHLPPFVQSMCKLKVISIRSSKRLKSIVCSLGGSSQLQSIEMKNVALITANTMPKLEKVRLEDVGEPTGMLSKLESWNLASLSVLYPRFLPSMGGLRWLPENCCQLRSLQLLQLWNCDNLYELPKELGNLSTTLVCLSIRDCVALKELPASLCKLQRLEGLEMEGSMAVEELPHNLGQLCALKELSLRYCYYLRNLPESFGNLSNLKLLDLFSCRTLSHLPRTFGQLVALKKLNLKRCRGLQDLPENFGLLRSLEVLALHRCSELKLLPQNFGLLSNLKQLYLNGCSKLKHLPESFVHLSCLKELDLSDCTELRNLPQNFGQLSCLKWLSLEDCSELQALPESFGQLCCLEALGLGGCEKLKHLPESFGLLSALKRWEMGGVELERLPASVGVGGLVALESVECTESVVPLWKAVRGDIAPHPQIDLLLRRNLKQQIRQIEEQEKRL